MQSVALVALNSVEYMELRILSVNFVLINRAYISWESSRHVGCGGYLILHDTRAVSIPWRDTAGYI